MTDRGITVHCFACAHSVIGDTPIDAHDRMEKHYEALHRALIRSLVADW